MIRRHRTGCGPEGRHEPTRPGPDWVLRCPCGAISLHPAPTPKEAPDGE